MLVDVNWTRLCLPFIVIASAQTGNRLELRHFDKNSSILLKQSAKTPWELHSEHGRYCFCYQHFIRSEQCFYYRHFTIIYVIGQPDIACLCGANGNSICQSKKLYFSACHQHKKYTYFPWLCLTERQWTAFVFYSLHLLKLYLWKISDIKHYKFNIMQPKLLTRCCTVDLALLLAHCRRHCYLHTPESQLDSLYHAAESVYWIPPPLTMTST